MFINDVFYMEAEFVTIAVLFKIDLRTTKDLEFALMLTFT